MNDLFTHITNLNKETQAWIDQDPKRWASMLADDVAMWNKQGIYTPEQLDHYLLVSDVYETTRSLFGYKPHWGNLNALTNAELQAQMDNLNAIARADYEREQHDISEHVKATEAAMNHATGFAIGDLALL
jgi:hypothetical protein